MKNRYNVTKEELNKFEESKLLYARSDGQDINFDTMQEIRDAVNISDLWDAIEEYTKDDDRNNSDFIYFNSELNNYERIYFKNE